MRVRRYAHSSLLFESGRSRILTDPLFAFDGTECFALKGVPPKVDQKLRDSLDAVFVSHLHGDHFSIPSLNFFNRKKLVLIPKGEGRLRVLLRTMGFKNIVELALYEKYKIGNLFLFTTPCADEAFEVGLVVEDQQNCFWHTIDCQLNTKIIRDVLSKAKPNYVTLSPRCFDFEWFTWRKSLCQNDPKVLANYTNWAKSFKNCKVLVLDQGWWVPLSREVSKIVQGTASRKIVSKWRKSGIDAYEFAMNSEVSGTKLKLASRINQRKILPKKYEFATVDEARLFQLWNFLLKKHKNIDWSLFYKNGKDKIVYRNSLGNKVKIMTSVDARVLLAVLEGKVSSDFLSMGGALEISAQGVSSPALDPIMNYISEQNPMKYYLNKIRKL